MVLVLLGYCRSLCGRSSRVSGPGDPHHRNRCRLCDCDGTGLGPMEAITGPCHRTRRVTPNPGDGYPSRVFPSFLAGEGVRERRVRGEHVRGVGASPLTRLAKPRHPLPQGERDRTTALGVFPSPLAGGGTDASPRAAGEGASPTALKLRPTSYILGPRASRPLLGSATERAGRPRSQGCPRSYLERSGGITCWCLAAAPSPGREARPPSPARGEGTEPRPDGYGSRRLGLSPGTRMKRKTPGVPGVGCVACPPEGVTSCPVPARRRAPGSWSRSRTRGSAAPR